MRVLVAGGAGFIGSEASRRLLAVGHKVVVLDDLSSGFTRNLDGVSASSRARSWTRSGWPKPPPGSKRSST